MAALPPSNSLAAVGGSAGCLPPSALVPPFYCQPAFYPLATSATEFAHPYFFTSQQWPIQAQNAATAAIGFHSLMESVDEREGSPDSENKKKRTLFDKKQVKVLEDVYKANQFINSTTRHQLAGVTRLRPNQVKIWFQNRRYKDKKRKKDMEMLMKREGLSPERMSLACGGSVLSSPNFPQLPSLSSHRPSFPVSHSPAARHPPLPQLTNHHNGGGGSQQMAQQDNFGRGQQPFALFPPNAQQWL